MQLRQVRIRRFRGISELDWTIAGRTICLVGPGDSTKTTILDALEWCLYPHWSIPVTDADFFQTATEEPIVIETTIGQLPGMFLSAEKFGFELRGWSEDRLRDEPEDEDEPVITVRLTIDESLEPRWEVVNDRQTEPRPISVRDREALGVVRVGSDVERHLTWGRRSALLRMTDSTEEMGRTLNQVHRSAREMVNAEELEALNEAAARASEAAAALGAGQQNAYAAALDPGAPGVGASGLALHDGPVPVRAAGLGSRRLASLAVQRSSFLEGAIVLIDEIEWGLEPHRLRHLVRSLRSEAAGQALMTTHSEIPIVELTTGELRVVISELGRTTVRLVPPEIQAPVRSAPDALLGRRLVVCEGKTEVGLCRALDQKWTSDRGVPPSHIGLVLVPGGGAEAPARSLALASLGYATALLVDSDLPLSPPEEELLAGGVSVFTWAGQVSTEERIMLDVPWEILVEIVNRASDLFNDSEPQAAFDAVASQLGATAGSNIEAWKTNFEEHEIRAAVGRAAKQNRWFKRTDLGEALGNIVAGCLPNIPQADLCIKLHQLSEWVYA